MLENTEMIHKNIHLGKNLPRWERFFFFFLQIKLLERFQLDLESKSSRPLAEWLQKQVPGTFENYKPAPLQFCYVLEIADERAGGNFLGMPMVASL